MTSPAAVVLAFTIACFSSNALQWEHSRPKSSDFESDDGWNWRYLDEKEVASRGSYCMDGSTPGYFYRKGTSDDKWVIAIEGGDMFCSDNEECNSFLEHDFVGHDSMVKLKLFDSSEFKDFHQVELHRCDGGLFMGDQSEPISIGGRTIYSRGKRIMEHVFDTLISNSTFAAATEVLITGGSGGGQVTILLADYMAGLMPASVKKIGAVPMSGWYTGNANDIESAFTMHAMSGPVAPACKEAYSENEQYNCLHPAVSYQYSTTPMFVVQVLDSQSLAGRYWENSSAGDVALEAWQSCMEHNTNCDSTKAQFLEDYLEEFVGEVQSIAKSKNPGEGGFISTCTKHVFFKEEEYSNYANDGTTIEDAVNEWWRNLGTSAQAKWYLPCELKTQGGQCQCESSCAFDSGSTD